MKRLNRAVIEGELCLEKAWNRPSSATRVTRAKKLKIDELLSSIITREKASDALYRQCFPDRVLIAEYIEEQEEAEERAKEAEQSRKEAAKAKGRPN